jgi:hypothetical protein
LEVVIKDTREIHNSLVAATEAVEEAHEAMMKEHAYNVAANAKAAEAGEPTPRTENHAETNQPEDLFSWDAPAPALVPTTVTQSAHSRGMSDISHTYGHTWGTEDTMAKSNNPSVAGDHAEEATRSSFKADDSKSVASAHTSNTGHQSAAHTANTSFQSAAHTVNTGRQAGFGGYQGHHEMGGANSSFFPMGAPASAQTHTMAMVPAPVSTSGAYDYGMDLMGMGAMTPMGASIPEPNPAAYNTPAPAPVHPPKVNSPTVAEVEAIKKEALEAEKSFRESMDLVNELSKGIQQLETSARKAEEGVQAAEKKKGSFTAKNKKKKEVAAAQELAAAERQKVNDARQQLIAAQKLVTVTLKHLCSVMNLNSSQFFFIHREADSSKKLAEELRLKSEQAELEAATAASMQPAANEHDHYGGMSNTADPWGNQNQGGYSNPFAMG